MANYCRAVTKSLRGTGRNIVSKDWWTEKKVGILRAKTGGLRER
jgi:hypothetical protein